MKTLFRENGKCLGCGGDVDYDCNCAEIVSQYPEVAFNDLQIGGEYSISKNGQNTILLLGIEETHFELKPIKFEFSLVLEPSGNFKMPIESTKIYTKRFGKVLTSESSTEDVGYKSFYN